MFYWCSLGRCCKGEAGDVERSAAWAGQRSAKTTNKEKPQIWFLPAAVCRGREGKPSSSSIQMFPQGVKVDLRGQSLGASEITLIHLSSSQGSTVWRSPPEHEKFLMAPPPPSSTCRRMSPESPVAPVQRSWSRVVPAKTVFCISLNSFFSWKLWIRGVKKDHQCVFMRL